MSNETDEEDAEEPISAEEQARIDALFEEHQIAWEAEATLTYGPPELRKRKNRRYTDRLVRRYSEPTIREILKALAKLKTPRCCENLSGRDLDEEPLEEIIRPFELLGLHFSVLATSGNQYTVDIGESYRNVGSGGRFLLERLDDCSFRLVDVVNERII